MNKISLNLQIYDDWLAQYFEEIVAKYSKRSIAVVNDEIVAVGDTEKEVAQSAREKYPDAIPFVFTVPAEEDLVFLL